MKKLGAGLLIGGMILALIAGFLLHSTPWTVTGAVFAVAGIILLALG